MKKLLLLTFAILTAGTACSGKSNNNVTKTETDMEMTENTTVIHLSKADFLAKV